MIKLCGGFFGGRSLGDLLPLRTRALGGLGAVRQDLGDTEDRDLVAIAALAARILAAALLERDDLRPALVVEHLDRNGRACDRRDAQDRRVTAEHQHFIQLYDRADFAFDLAYFENIIRHDAVLLAAGFDDSRTSFFLRVQIPASRRESSGPAFCQSLWVYARFVRAGVIPLKTHAKQTARGNAPRRLRDL